MRLLIGLVVVLCLCPVFADDLPSISLGKIYAAISHDWNGDGILDHALLVAGKEDIDADLHLVLATGDWSKHEAFSWAGGMYRRPHLELNEAGSLVVIAANDAIGRNRWESRTTIAFRDGIFVVAGFDYSSYDTLDLENTLDFSINYLSGESVRNGAAKKGEAKRIPVGEWKEPTEFY